MAECAPFLSKTSRLLVCSLCTWTDAYRRLFEDHRECWRLRYRWSCCGYRPHATANHVRSERPANNVRSDRPANHVSSHRPANHVRSDRPDNHVYSGRPTNHVRSDRPANQWCLFSILLHAEWRSGHLEEWCALCVNPPIRRDTVWRQTHLLHQVFLNFGHFTFPAIGTACVLRRITNRGAQL